MKATLAAILICLCGHAAATTCASTPPDHKTQDPQCQAPLVRTAAEAPAAPQPRVVQPPPEPPEQRKLLLAGVVLMLAIALRHHSGTSR